MTFAEKGSIFRRIHKFVSDRYESGNFSETTTVALLKKYDYISDEALSGIRKQHTRAVIKAMVGDFNKLNLTSKSSNTLMIDLFEMTCAPRQ